MSLGDGELETAIEMASALGRAEVRVAELADRALRRAEEWQPVTNAFSQLWADRALEAAGEAPAGTGVPLAVKDLFDVAGRETTGCCRAYRGRVAAADAPTVSRMRAAGATIIGKTNQHELAAGGTNAVSAYGPARNPWDPERITGGSSGGSAAAVAAGVVPWALGSDTGGSIRIPASMCGTFGLKPTTGRLSIEGLLPLAPSMDCPGPIAATVADLWELYRLMARGDVEVGPLPDRPPDGAARRIGVPDGFFADLVHPEALSTVRWVAETLEEAGETIEPVDGHGLEDARRVWMAVCTPEFAAAHPGLLGERRERVAPSVLEWLEAGAARSPEEREAANRRRREIGRWFVERLEDRDALLVPTTPYPAPRLDEEEVDLGAAGSVEVARVGPGWMTCSVNLAGLPAVNLPAGWASSGVPIGVSLVGRPDGEATLVALARRWEEASGYRPGRPRRPARRRRHDAGSA